MEILDRDIVFNINQDNNVIREFLSYQHLYNAAIKEVTTKLEILDEEFQNSYEHNPIHHIETRLKKPRSILKKVEKYKIPLTVDSISEHIMDIAGVRVVCNYVEDIYTIADLLTKQNDIILIKKKDYIKNPKENGYRSLHLIVKVPIFLSTDIRNVPVEIQIRTIAMDFWASLEHCLRYKGNEKETMEITDRLNICAEKISEIDLEMQDIYNNIRNK